MALALGIGASGAQSLNVRLTRGNVVRQLITPRNQRLHGGMGGLEGLATVGKLRFRSIHFALGETHGIAASGEGAIALAKLTLETAQLGLGGAEPGLRLNDVTLCRACAGLLALLLLPRCMQPALHRFQGSCQNIGLGLGSSELGFERADMGAGDIHCFGLLLLFALEVGLLTIEAGEALTGDRKLALGGLEIAVGLAAFAPQNGKLGEQCFTPLADVLSKRVFNGEGILQLLDALLADALGLFRQIVGRLCLSPLTAIPDA